MNVAECQTLLKENQGIVILKFGADWCGPCKAIEPLVQHYLTKLPKNVKIYMLNIDQNLEIYTFFKNKKRLNGIPALLAFYKGNESYIPNDMVNGANHSELTLFFERCIKKSV